MYGTVILKWLYRFQKSAKNVEEKISNSTSTSSTSTSSTSTSMCLYTHIFLCVSSLLKTIPKTPLAPSPFNPSDVIFLCMYITYLFPHLFSLPCMYYTPPSSPSSSFSSSSSSSSVPHHFQTLVCISLTHSSSDTQLLSFSHPPSSPPSLPPSLPSSLPLYLNGLILAKIACPLTT